MYEILPSARPMKFEGYENMHTMTVISKKSLTANEK